MAAPLKTLQVAAALSKVSGVPVIAGRAERG